MAYLPATDADRAEMLATLGLQGPEELFAPVPQEARFPVLNLGRAMGEPELISHIADLAGKNLDASKLDWFLGAGIYHHFIPATVDALASRGEFLSAYTPYQPEVSQGTLQVMYEYQSMIARLFGMDFANAGHYDGATALAESLRMVLEHSKGKTQNSRPKIAIPQGLHPEYRQVLDTYLEPASCQVKTYTGDPALQDFAPDHACVVVAWPDFFGTIFDLKKIATRVHGQGAYLVVLADPLMCGLFASPGSCGADVVVAEGQSLGNAMNSGGPGLGIMAVGREFMRRIPGRLAGEARDASGRRGYVLTLVAREQHIRRERAVSNICSNQGLVMLRSTIYLSLMGRRGFRDVARLCWDKSQYLAAQISALEGFRVLTGTHFKELLLSCPIPAEHLVEQLLTVGIMAGLALSRYYPERSHELLVCVTELNSKESMDRLVAALASLGRKHHEP